MFDSFDEIPSLFITEDTEFFPLMSNDEEEEINKEPIPDILPILPLRNTVLSPGVIFPITVGRDKSITLIRKAYKANSIIVVVNSEEEGVGKEVVRTCRIRGGREQK